MKKISYVPVLLIFLFIHPGVGWGASPAADVKQGNLLYRNQDYSASLEKFLQAYQKDSESDIINFNVGTAYYKAGDYEKALEYLPKALLSEKPEIQRDAHFNAGNAEYKRGLSLEEKDINAAIQALEKSLAHYEGAMKIDAQDADAEFNYNFVKKELERLKEKMQQQPQQQCPRPQQGEKDQQDKDEGQEQEQQGSSEEEKREGQQEQQPSPSPEEKQKEQEEQPQPAPGQEQQQPASAQDSMPGQEKDMSQREAEMMLNDYEQNEEPRGIINFLQNQQGRERPVGKDW